MRNRFTLIALLFVCRAQAQWSEGGTPASFQPEIQSFISGKAPVIVNVASVDREALLLEDSKTPGQTRFAAAVEADITLLKDGQVSELPDGRKLWQCTVRSAGALGLTLIFDRFYLPAGARFFAYTPEKNKTWGAYTSTSCLPSGKFLIGILPGETAVMECIFPAETTPDIHLNRVDASYDHAAMGAEFDFGESLSCNVNVNCPSGTNWQQEKKGIARILMVFQSGEAWCSGTLVANTSGSYEPYFLTAHHCQLLLANPDFNLWRFDFDYETAGCTNPATEPPAKSVLGCTRTAFRTETDFMLLKLNSIPASYEVYFNGWDRDNTPTTIAAGSVMIHHPRGDIKKITVENQASNVFPNTLDWGGIFGISPANSHWRTVPDVGIQEPGSSGSPLFGPDKRIRGQLHGGSVNMNNPCIMTGVYYGRFNQSWDQGSSNTARLKDWLDPGNTGAVTQNGYLRPAVAGFDLGGNVKTHWGVNMPNVTVQLSAPNGTNYMATTDTLGKYLFSDLPAGAPYTLFATRDNNDLNGVTTYDLVLASRHILGIEALSSPWKIIAADANSSNSLTTFDVVETRKVILGVNSTFPANTSWRFFPENTTFANPTNPFTGTFPLQTYSINLQSDMLNVNFLGVKIGDTNNTADPGQ